MVAFLLSLVVVGPVAAQPAPAPPPPASPAASSAPATPPAEGQAAPAAAAPAVQAIQFTSPAGALLMSVAPAKTADFESLIDLYTKALATSEDDAAKALASGLRVYKAGEPAPGGANVLYVMLVDPAVAEADYSWQAVLTTIVTAFPDKQQDVFEKGTGVHAGPMNKLTLTPVPAPLPVPPPPPQP
jgi:hypothetical protein